MVQNILSKCEIERFGNYLYRRDKMKNKIIPSHFFTVNEQSLVSMFCQGKKQFIIPYNQRPWSWKDKDLLELWKDVLKTADGFFYADLKSDSWLERESPIRDPHFIGAFVFEEKDNNFSVVDGQQRITSITMLMAALRNEAEELKCRATGDLKRTVNHHLDSYRSWLISSFDEDQLNTRLELDDNLQDFFTLYVVEYHSQVERDDFLGKLDLDEPSIKSLKKSFDYITKLVNSFIESFSENEKQYRVIKALYTTIEECFICISSSVKKESFSYEVFKCLNAKGVPLTEADKLKNELFTQSKISEHQDIKNSWSQMSENVPSAAAAQFIRLRHVALYGECNYTKMHSIITEKELHGKSIPNVVKNWEDDSQIYSWITRYKSQDEKNAYNKDEIKILDNIKQLKVSPSEILLFSAHKHLFNKNRADFLEILRITENFCFRNLTISKKDTPQLELHIGKAARAIKEQKTVKEIRKMLRDSSPSSEFVQNFSTFTARNTATQFYILKKIDEHKLTSSGLQIAEHSQEFNVEHIMPKKIETEKRDNEWSWAVTDIERHKQMVNRVGNLCLLEGGINRDVSNYDWQAKRYGKYPDKHNTRKNKESKMSYLDSELPMVKELVADYEEWSFDLIEERQKKLADLADAIWKI